MKRLHLANYHLCRPHDHHFRSKKTTETVRNFRCVLHYYWPPCTAADLWNWVLLSNWSFASLGRHLPIQKSWRFCKTLGSSDDLPSPSKQSMKFYPNTELKKRYCTFYSGLSGQQSMESSMIISISHPVEVIPSPVWLLTQEINNGHRTIHHL